MGYTHIVCFSDRFLPDKAIDLIDEAGSRVRLRHAQVMIFLFDLLSPSLNLQRIFLSFPS